MAETDFSCHNKTEAFVVVVSEFLKFEFPTNKLGNVWFPKHTTLATASVQAARL